MRDAALNERCEVNSRASELLDHHRFVRESPSTSAVLLRQVAEEKTDFPSFCPRIVSGPLPPSMTGGDGRCAGLGQDQLG